MKFFDTRKIITVIIFAIMGLIWWYLANKFEEQAKIEIANFTQKYDSYISYDQDSMQFEKYNFQVTLDNFVVHSNDPDVKMKLDKLILRYNPLADIITVKFGGDRFTFGEGEKGVYITDPDWAFRFDRSLYKGDWENFKFNLNSRDFSMYFSESDMLISRFSNLNIDLSNELKDDMYGMKVSCSTQHVKNNLSAQHVNQITKLIFSSEDSKANPKFFENLEKVVFDPRVTSYLEEFKKEIGRMRYSYAYGIKLEKKNVLSLIEVYKGNKKLEDFISEFSYFDDKYSVFADEKVSNNLMHSNLNIKFDNNGQKFKSIVDIQNTKRYSESSKEDFKSVLYPVIVDVLKESGDKSEKAKISSMLYTEIVGLFLAIDNYQFNLDFDYDIASHDSSQKLKAKINGVIYDLTSELKDKKYDGVFKISHPKALTETLPKIYDEKFRPILTKIADSKVELYKSFGKKDVPIINHTFDNIRENGFGLVASLHKKKNLSEDEELNMNIKINFDQAQNITDMFKINDKSFFEIIADPRVTKFMEYKQIEQEVKE